MESFGIVFFVLFGVVSAQKKEMSDVDRLQEYEFGILLQCAIWHGVTKEKLLEVASNTAPQVEPCFYACFLKNTGAMNSKGLFDPDAALARHKQFITNEIYLTQRNEINQECASSENKKQVGDGDIGCQRANLIIECMSQDSSRLQPFAGTPKSVIDNPSFWDGLVLATTEKGNYVGK